MSKLVVLRSRSSEWGTFGHLYIDCPDGTRHLVCSTLEPLNCDGEFMHGLKFGDYRLSMTFSPKFRRNLPLISAKGRDGIRIHAGNTFEDTTGCILVGVYASKTRLYNSRCALRYVLDLIKEFKIDSLSIMSDNPFLDPNYIP